MGRPAAAMALLLGLFAHDAIGMPIDTIRVGRDISRTSILHISTYQRTSSHATVSFCDRVRGDQHDPSGVQWQSASPVFVAMVVAAGFALASALPLSTSGGRAFVAIVMGSLGRRLSCSIDQQERCGWLSQRPLRKKDWEGADGG